MSSFHIIDLFGILMLMVLWGLVKGWIVTARSYKKCPRSVHVFHLALVAGYLKLLHWVVF